MVNKKKKVEIKGTKFQKICLLLQVIMIVLMIICARYASANNLETGFAVDVNKYGIYVVLGLLIVPYIFGGNK